MNTAEEKNTKRGVWSEEEHDKFLIGIKTFPNGPWKMIAEQIGTRSARQVQTHAQKYYEKVARRLRGLRKHRKKLARPEHRLGDDMMRMCAVATPSDPTSATSGSVRAITRTTDNDDNDDDDEDDDACGDSDAVVDQDSSAEYARSISTSTSSDAFPRDSQGHIQLPSLQSVCCLHKLGCGQLRSSSSSTWPNAPPLLRSLPPSRPARMHSLNLILHSDVK